MRNRQLTNLIANLAGVAGALCYPLIFNVAYYRLLGGEAYGLVGFYGSLAGVALLFEFGLAQATMREVARRASDPARSAELRGVVATFLMLALALGAALGCAIVVLSPWLAQKWLGLLHMAPGEASEAAALMGGSIALLFPNTILGMTLRGLQRQVICNAFGLTAGAVRGVATIAALLLCGPSPLVFFSVQLACSAGEFAALTVIVHRAVPRSHLPIRPDLGMLRQSWGFGSANGLTALIGQAVMISDKVVLSTVLPLELFGLYTLTFTVAGSITKMTGPFTNAYLPHFIELVEQSSWDRLSKTYHFVTQIASAVVVPAGMAMALYAEPILLLLTGNAEGARTLAPVLLILAASNMLNSLMWLPCALQLACNAAWLTLRINLVQATIYLLLLVPLVTRYGIYAPPTLLLLANILVFPVYVAFTHRIALRGEAAAWLMRGILLPGAAAAAVILAGFLVLPTPGPVSLLPWLAANCLAAAAIALTVTPDGSTFLRVQIDRRLRGAGIRRAKRT